MVTPSVIPFKNKFVNEISGNKEANKPEYLDRKSYENAMNKLNYALFFYEKNQYVFRTSGAIADAIGCCIPFLVLKHPIFDYIFEQAGNVGFICENLNEMEQIIKKINLKEPETTAEYQLQIQNLKNFQTKISVSFIANDLKNQMKTHLLL